jgi:hypothetical protein
MNSPPRYYPGQDLESMIGLFRANYLTDTGWLRSAELKDNVNAVGPIPWMTYPAIAALQRIIRPDMHVFEFGSGGSTVWWGQHVAKVVAVEHDPDWARQVAKQIRSTDRIISRAAGTPAGNLVERYLFQIDISGFDTAPANDGKGDRDFAGYLHALLEFPPGAFDVIVIDGMARNTAGAIACEMVGCPHGIVVLDNSDRDCYDYAYSALKACGFARIDFWGPGPINPYGWCTSIFTRSLEPFR